MLQWRFRGSEEQPMRPEILFIHGAFTRAARWDPWFKFFSDAGYRCVAPSLPAHDPPDPAALAGLTFADYLEAIREVHSTFDRPPVVIGHSMGGPVIIEAARLAPERVATVVGADTYQDFSFIFEPEQLEAFLQPFRDDFASATYQFVNQMFPPDADPDLVRMVASDMSAAPPEIAVSVMSNLWQYDMLGALEQMRKPIYSINCDMWPTNVEANRELTASFDLRTMPGVGHFVHMEDPDSFNGHLSRICRTVWGDAPGEQP